MSKGHRIQKTDGRGIAVWWVRRDLRLTDNQALAAALDLADRVIPVFALDSRLLSSPYVGEKRLAFLYHGLGKLDEELRQRGGRLVIRSGDPVEALVELVRESGAHAVVAEADYSPYARLRDRRAAKALPLHLTGGLIVHPPEAVLKADNTPYTVFTPFSRRWKALPPLQTSSVLPAPAQIRTLEGLHSLPIPTSPLQPLLPAGSEQGSARLSAFIDGPEAPVYGYGDRRNRMDLAGTSQLSPYLRFGMLSARQAVVSAYSAIDAVRDPQARSAAETWLNQLIWREFYVSILYHFPHVRRESFRPYLRALAWRNDEDEFLAWSKGRTGYPVVDAAMRQLVATGWMPNRARMVVASFLTKDLLIDWRWGERFFMQHLVDGDPAANNGGWQWTAGTGTDAAPYFRIFNPVTQGKKFDPYGVHVRRWVPELERVPDRFIHEPWRMSFDEQRAAGCLIGRDYPAPIVDHGQAREMALHRHDQAKTSATPELQLSSVCPVVLYSLSKQRVGRRICGARG